METYIRRDVKPFLNISPNLCPSGPRLALYIR